MAFAVAALGMRPCDFRALTLREFYAISNFYAKMHGSKDDEEESMQEFVANYIATHGLES